MNGEGELHKLRKQDDRAKAKRKKRVKRCLSENPGVSCKKKEDQQKRDHEKVPGGTCGQAERKAEKVKQREIFLLISVAFEKTQKNDREKEERIRDRESEKKAEKKTSGGIKKTGQPENNDLTARVFSEYTDQMGKEGSGKTEAEGLKDGQSLRVDGCRKKGYGERKDSAKTLQIDPKDTRAHTVVEGVAAEIGPEKAGAEDFHGGQLTGSVPERMNHIDVGQYKEKEPEDKAKRAAE